MALDSGIVAMMENDINFAINICNATLTYNNVSVEGVFSPSEFNNIFDDNQFINVISATFTVSKSLFVLVIPEREVVDVDGIKWIATNKNDDGAVVTIKLERAKDSAFTGSPQLQ